MDTEIKQIKQKELSSECFAVQIWGPKECNRCEFKDKKDCGGKQIRKTGKNKLGYNTPLGG